MSENCANLSSAIIRFLLHSSNGHYDNRKHQHFYLIASYEHESHCFPLFPTSVQRRPEVLAHVVPAFGIVSKLLLIPPSGLVMIPLASHN
jgi:hypothetical protein